MYEKHLKAYITLKVSTLGMSFSQFINLPREEMSCLINVLQEKEKP
jgi:hypothetical protein